MIHKTPPALDPAPTNRLPDISQALPWRNWELGVAEAQRRRVPILALAEPPWTNTAQRLGLVLSEEPGLRGLLAEGLVPVRIDSAQRPDLVGRWQRAAMVLEGGCGPPLLLLLTHEGLPFLSYCTMWPEGRTPHPSLAALARATADAYARDPDAFLSEAQTLDATIEGSTGPSFRSTLEVWQGLAGEVDPVHGGLRQLPKHPHPQLLLLLLDLEKDHEEPDAGAFVLTTLRAMLRGGINDQIGAGFHRCSRDERWIVPHFEKPVPLNAQLASVYARAAHVSGDEELLAVANGLAAFCLELTRQGVDAVAADSHYYTWTARELLDALPPSLVQAVSLHFNTTPDGSRQVLYRARDLETLGTLSNEAPETLRGRLEDGRGRLRTARAGRVPPALVRLATLSWPAQTIHWLFRAAEYGYDGPVVHLGVCLDRLAAKIREEGGYARPGADGQAWLEDQAGVLAAMLAAFRVTREQRWLDQARTLADVILDRYGHDGGWLDRPRGSGVPEISRAVVDDVLPSSIATLTAALADLGSLLGDDRYRERARLGAATHLPGPDSGSWAAAMWRAWFDVA